jgi:hypothetical protein
MHCFHNYSGKFYHYSLVLTVFVAYQKSVRVARCYLLDQFPYQLNTQSTIVARCCLHADICAVLLEGFFFGYIAFMNYTDVNNKKMSSCSRNQNITPSVNNYI